MILRSWKAINRGKLIGKAAVTLPTGMEIDDVPVLREDGGGARACLPGTPVIGRDGRVARIPSTDRINYEYPIRWRDKKQADQFSWAVTMLISEHYGPDALEGETQR